MRRRSLSIAAAVVFATSCTAEPDGFTIGGTVSGMDAGTRVTLELLTPHGTETLVVPNGPFEFEVSVDTGDTYSIAVPAAPAGHVCQVKNASGTVASGHVSNVEIACARP